jgi:aspartyl-tRNA(Asn)/glutamyl-tRNA(Gln) amidotransferase subunit A
LADTSHRGALGVCLRPAAELKDNHETGQVEISSSGASSGAARDRSSVVRSRCPHGLPKGSIERARALGAFVSELEKFERSARESTVGQAVEEATPGPLAGMPLAVKDNIDVAGSITAAGSDAFASNVAAFDAHVVRLLREAGGVVAARTRMDEFAFTTSGPEMKNPFDEDRSVGGSSGGSAVAVAAGGFCAALGTDTGGSVRIPASYCGVVGFKPSFGSVALDGVVPLAPSFDHVGVLACSVGVARRIFGAIVEDRTPDATRAVVRGWFDQLRVGVPNASYLAAATDEVRAAFDDAISLLRQEGVETVEIELPSFERVLKIHYPIGFVEALRYHSATFADLSRHGSHVRDLLRQAREYSQEDYSIAQAERRVLKRELTGLLRTVDVVALPTTPTTAPRRESKTIRLGTGTEVDRVAGSIWYTVLFNDTGVPAISLPWREAGALPVGLQFATRHGADEYLLDLSQEIESLLARATRPPRQMRRHPDARPTNLSQHC